ncbi:MAG: tetratricopeptide repeat protein, partial [bacterium]|nr:tetratricopeptide repeat protein [bacterium]
NTLNSLNNLAAIMESQGELDAARPLLEQAYQLHREHLGDTHPNTLGSLNNLLSLLAEQGDSEALEAIAGDLERTGLLDDDRGRAS